MSVQDRREREKEQRRQSILDAAERLFLSKGLHATMEEIATAAEVAKGTLYLYFHSKEDLYLTLVCKAFDVMNGYFRAVALEKLHPKQMIRSIGDAYIRFADEQPQYFQLLSDSMKPIASSEVSPVLLETLYARTSEAWSIITTVLQKGIDDGVFRNDISAFEMAIIFWNNTSGLIRQIGTAKSAPVWRETPHVYALHRLDLGRMLEVSNGLLLEAISR